MQKLELHALAEHAKKASADVEVDQKVGVFIVYAVSLFIDVSRAKKEKKSLKKKDIKVKMLLLLC